MIEKVFPLTLTLILILTLTLTLTLTIDVGDRMFLGKQEFDFAQVESNLSKFNHFCPNPTKFSHI